MLESLVNNNLLVYDLVTSKNGYSLMDMRQDNQQERLVSMKLLSDDYLIGFTEGEGMFYIGIVRSLETKTGWQVIYFLKVSQNPIGIEVLNQFKDRLGCGYIKQNSQTDKTDKSLAYVVRDFLSLKKKVIPFFEGKLVIKKEAFEKFLWWMQAIAVIQLYPTSMESDGAKNKILRCFQIVQELLSAEENSGYQVDKLLTAARGS